MQLNVSREQVGFVSHGLGRVYKLVEHFHMSINATYALQQKQQLLGVLEHALVQQCKQIQGEVWILQFMQCDIERVVEQQQAFALYC